MALGNPSCGFAQQSNYDSAVAARLAGDPERAVALLESWIVANPADADALVQYGYALLALGRLPEAEAAFRQALGQAPQYADAQQGLSLVMVRRNGELSDDRQGLLSLDVALSSLEAPQSDWSEAGIALAMPAGGRGRFGLDGRWYRRFGIEDVQIGANYTHRAGEDVWLRAGVSATPSPDFRPGVAASGGLDYRLARDLILSLDAEWQDFPLDSIWSFGSGMTRYFDDGRYAVTARARAIVPDSSNVLLGGSLRADFIPRDRTRLFVGGATGPETDLGVVSDTTSVFAGLELPLDGATSMQANIAQDWREIGAERLEVRIAIKLNF